MPWRLPYSHWATMMGKWEARSSAKAQGLDSQRRDTHLMAIDDCPYCPVRPPARVHFANELVQFVVDERYQGALKHSGIIIPFAHRSTLFELTSDEWRATFELLGAVKAWMDETWHPDGYNVGWNCGATAGQEVFHAHMHVIPRFRQEPLAGSGIRALLKSDANRY